MVWHLFPPRRIPRAERMIDEHARWLSQVLRYRLRVPRIPTRRVSDGGYSRLSRSAAGRARAARWWARVLEETSLDA